MTSGFSTIAGSVLAAYINLGVPPENLVTSSVMSIPASMAISKMRIPEMEEPVTRGRITVDRGIDKSKAPVSVLTFLFNEKITSYRQMHSTHSARAPFSALLLLARSYGYICYIWRNLIKRVLKDKCSDSAITGGNVRMHLHASSALLNYTFWRINGLLTWIGKGFGIHHLTLQLGLRYLFYPITFFLGVPRAEILRVSEFMATKLVANEFSAYQDLQKVMTQSDNPLSQRAYTICSYALCGFANLGSLGIQIGVLGALAPSRSKVIAQIALSAMVCGFLSTLQTASIACVRFCSHLIDHILSFIFSAAVCSYNSDHGFHCFKPLW